MFICNYSMNIILILKHPKAKALFMEGVNYFDESQMMLLIR